MLHPVSVRGQQMPASPIRKLTPYAYQAKQRGIHIHHLNIGQPDISSPSIVFDTLKTMDNSIISYGDSAGNLSYRKALCEKYFQPLDIEIKTDEILITNGASEAVLFAFTACLDPDDEVIVPEPFYTNYLAFASQTGVILKPITTIIENNFALPEIETFEQLITRKTKAILICNPNNPTGYLYTQQEIEALAKLVKKHNLYLFVDEAYREFNYTSEKFYSALSLTGVEDHVILFDSISKRYSMCGARIGMLISRNKEVIATSLKFAQARLCPPFLGQLVAERLLDLPTHYFQEIHQEYLLRRNFLVENLNRIEGVYSPTPGGAFYTVVTLPVENTEHFAQWLLEKFSYRNQTVMITPAAGFYVTPGLGDQQVRMAYVLNREDLGKAVTCLQEALQQYND